MHLYAIFHLNLAFSSIDEEQHSDVIKHCYWPLLHIIEQHNIPLGIEASVYTLEKIQAKDNHWIETFKALLGKGQCELIASGDSQIIGPLVPAVVNDWNLKLGKTGYQKILNAEPIIAYINEQTLSSGLLDIYIDNGYQAVMMEWDNASAINSHWHDNVLHRPAYATAHSGRKIPILWNWSIAFQKLQRLAHHQLSAMDYQQFIIDGASSGVQALPIYGNDAEVFDFRPGRFNEENHRNEQSEWKILSDCFTRLTEDYQWLSPSHIIHQYITDSSPCLNLTTAESPVIVKKQKKYNLTRWAISGKNDLLLNTLCFRQYKQLLSNKASAQQWQALCRLWASDLRTHLTKHRYRQLLPLLVHVKTPLTQAKKAETDQQQAMQFPELRNDTSRNRLCITVGCTELNLNMKRGATIDSLCFNGNPVIGTLHHGYFDNIQLGADFYSNHCLIELVTERKRITDLSDAHWTAEKVNNTMIIRAEVTTDFCTIVKTYTVYADNVVCRVELSEPTRPVGIIRLGWLTLLKTDGKLPVIGAHHGGRDAEFLSIGKDVDHGQPSSTFVSANNCLGATEGQLWFGEPANGIKVHWDQAQCAAIPMLYTKTVGQHHMSRLFFSLSELDETQCSGGNILPFEYTLSSWIDND